MAKDLAFGKIGDKVAPSAMPGSIADLPLLLCGVRFTTKGLKEVEQLKLCCKGSHEHIGPGTQDLTGCLLKKPEGS